jgi:phage-related protein
MSANPIGLVVIAIAALVAGLVIAYKKSETFRDIVNGAFNGVRAVASTVFSAIGGFVSKALEKVEDFWGFIKTLPGKISSAFSNIGEGIGNGFKGAVNGIIGKLNSIFIGGLNKIVSGANKLPGVNLPSFINIPLMDTGGVVRGPGLVAVGPGITEAFVMSRGNGQPVAGNTVINVTVNAPVGSSPEDVGR